MTPDVSIILTSVATAEDAERMAETLVELRLAACVQVSAAGKSVYQWQGRIEKEPEVYLSIKTTSGKTQDVAGWLEANHPFETPEILILSAASGQDYLQWMRASVA